MEVAIIPKDEKITVLPEYSYLGDLETHDGRSFESLRGVNTTIGGLALMATAEEQLLGLKMDLVRYIAHTTVHEFAHGIQNLCFTAEDHSEWNAFYDSALQDNLYPETYLMSNTREFFAVFSTAYFEVYSWDSLSNSRDQIEDDHPAIFEFLDEVYGGAELSPESKRLTPQ
ncbi:MAG: zinc-dependent peptidase [Dehalococcoidia bacterium]|nr:zinc-dependent peptidase [Dehalococcoidia bacterium]